MEKLTALSRAKYIIDASSILSQNPTEKHRRHVQKSLWEKIDSYIHDGIIVTCSEVAGEIKDKDIKSRLQELGCVELLIDDEIQLNVRKIVTDVPNMIEFTPNNSGSSSGDAFLIATAMKYGLTVITEENKDKRYKIPQICKRYGIEAIDILMFCEKESWSF